MFTLFSSGVHCPPLLCEVLFGKKLHNGVTEFLHRGAQPRKGALGSKVIKARADEPHKAHKE